MQVVNKLEFELSGFWCVGKTGKEGKQQGCKKVSEKFVFINLKFLVNEFKRFFSNFILMSSIFCLVFLIKARTKKVALQKRFYLTVVRFDT